MTVVAEVANRPRVAEHGSDRRLAYAPGLDGLRALAVLGVLLFHADYDWITGGFLGVDVFFVLSGFLITSLLLRELRLTDRVRFSRFYLGRVRRLFPALLVTLVLAAVLALTVAPDAAERLRGDIVASFFYVSNWWFVHDGLSYFEQMGRAPLLRHLWTLSIEEQFYFVWPLAVYGLFRWGGRLRVATVAAVGAVASTAWMAYLAISADAPATVDPSQIYFRTDAHAMGLLLGASFAALWQMDLLPTRIPAVSRLVLTVVGLVGLVGIGAFFLFVGYDTVWLYHGGYLLLAAIVVLVIAAAVHPALRFGRVLGWGPMHYVGTRSYGLYLYHWPIFMVLRPGVDLPFDGVPATAVQFAVTFAVAEASYRFVEMPIRHGALGRAWTRLRESWGSVAWGVAGAAVLTLGLLVGSLNSALATAKPAGELEGFTQTASKGAGDLLDEPADPQPSPSPHLSDGAKPSHGSGSKTDPSASPGTSKPASTDLSLGPITAVGDSVMLGDEAYLEHVFPKIVVDAAVGRQSGAVFARIRQRLGVDRLAPTVIIHTGTNGTIVASDLEATIKAMGPDRTVVLVTTHVARSWQDANNAILAAAAKAHPNVRLVDWYAISKGKQKWFADGIHMNRVGGRYYTSAIADALGADPKRVEAALDATFNSP